MVGAKVVGDKLGLAVVGASVVGDFEGDAVVGFVDGDFDGLFVTGFFEGLEDGSGVTGLALGLNGASVGRELGSGGVGSAVGFIDGLLVGPTLGLELGDTVVVIAGVNAGIGLLVAKIPSQSISKSFDGNFCPFSSSVPPPVKKNWVNGLELMSINPSLEFLPFPPPASFLPPCFF